MTLKEMVRQYEPNRVDCKFDGGVRGCPADYTYLNNAVSLPTCNRDCESCWNQEFSQMGSEPNFGIWISCKDMMPEDGQWVLVCTKDKFITAMQYDNSDPPCFLDDHEEFFGVVDVIYWMPCPNLPDGI